MSPRWLWSSVLLVVAVGLMTLVVVIVLAILPGTQTLPAAKRTPDLPPAEGQRADIAYLRNLPKAEGSFTPVKRAAFERELAALEAKAGTLDPTAFELGVSHAIAGLNNGHSNTHGSARGRSANALPLRMLAFSDGLYVVKARPALADLLGAQVLAVSGRTPQALAPILGAYVGGNTAYKAQFAPYLLEEPAALHAMGLLPDAAGADVTFRLPDGAVRTRRIAAVDGPIIAGDEDRRPQRDLSPLPVAGEQGQWRHVLAAPPPLWLAHVTRRYWTTALPSGALYVQINRTRDEANGSLEGFLADVVKNAQRTRPKAVIVDLRFNTGGNYDLALRFARDLPKAMAPDAPIYVLVGPNTFSAAIVTAARLKVLGRGRTVIVGEPVGDDLKFWAEGDSVILPYSGLKVRYSNAYHDWADGCGLRDLGRCYGKTYLFGVAARTLAPDVPVALSFADYVHGADPVMARVERDIMQRRQTATSRP